MAVNGAIGEEVCRIQRSPFLTFTTVVGIRICRYNAKSAGSVVGKVDIAAFLQEYSSGGTKPRELSSRCHVERCQTSRVYCSHDKIRHPLSVNFIFHLQYLFIF